MLGVKIFLTAVFEMFSNRVVMFSALAFLFALSAKYSKAEEDIDCRQRPKKLIKTSVYCCETPQRNLDDYQDLCFKSTENNTLRCQMDCLFQAANVLENETLNLAKLHKMLEKIFPNASDFVAAFYISFVECVPLVNTLIAEGRSLQKVKPHCEPVAIFYAACAQIKLLKNCPKNAWNTTSSCENAQTFVTKCEKNLLPQRRKPKKGEQLRIEASVENKYENLNTTTINTMVD